MLQTQQQPPFPRRITLVPLPSSPATQPFEQHLREAFHRLRAAFTEALAAVGADAHRPRPMARELGISKSLAWRVSKVVAAREPADAVPHVPGPDALGAFITALRKAGAGEGPATALREAMAAYDSMVAAHTGDRQTLDQLTASMSEPRAAERLEAGRRQAYLGMGGTWGVQARVQFSTTILQPSTERTTHLDVVGLKGLVDLRRLRGDARWTLFRRTRRLDDGSGLPPFRTEALDPQLGSEELPLLREFCSPGAPDLVEQTSANVSRYILPAGPVGNTNASTHVFGELNRGALPAPGPEDDRLFRIGAALLTPVERLQLDLIVSEDLPWAHDPGIALYAQLDGGGRSLADDDDQRLPVFESVHELGRGLGTMASADVPRYGEMLHSAFERAGWEGSGFCGYRFTMRYPPIPTVAVFTCEHEEG